MPRRSRLSFTRTDNPAMLLHMIAEDRDLLSAETQEMKRETWLKAQREHQIRMDKHQAQIEQNTQKIMKQYQQKIDKDAEDVRKFLEKLELDRKKEADRIDRDYEMRNTKMRQTIDKIVKEEKERQEKIRLEEEKKKAKEQEDRKQQEEQKQAAATKAQAEKEQKEQKEQRQKELLLKKQQASLNQKSSTLSIKGLEEAGKYFDLLKKFKEQIKPAISQHTEWKQGAMKSRMKLKRMIGQLVNKRETIMRITNDAHTIFADCQRTSDVLYEWIMNFTAKALVEQAETEVTVKPSTAYPLAHVTVLLATKHAGFMDIVIARLIKHCPYIIPRYFDDDPNRSPDETRKLMGYKYNDKEAKQWEDAVQYKEHMSGLISLWAAIVQTVPEPGMGENPYPIQHGWTWLARICNIPPRAITPALINAFLEIAGERMLATYPRQLPKVLQLIMQQYLPLLASDKDAVAAATRLSSYLETYATSGKLGAIEGSRY
ncbi:GLE1-like protein-domain-containing protein [Umbelopsis sp. AD052]|nr:GLE1-like protein-domain-containing protein [Umbelopsis sp. AD052]